MRFILAVAVLAGLLFLSLLVFKKPEQTATPWPASGKEHPFYESMKDVDVSPTGEMIAREEIPPAEEATNVRTARGEVAVGDARLAVEIEATPEVSDAALKNLMATLRAVPFDGASRKDLEQFYGDRKPLLKGVAEARLPAPIIANKLDTRKLAQGQSASKISGYYFAFPENWVMARPGVIRLNPDYPEPREDRDDSGVALATAALTGSWAGVRGRLQCQPPGEAAFALPFVEVTINDVRATANRNGDFEIPGPFTEVTGLMIRYDGRVLTAAGGPGPRVSVMNDFHNPRPETVDIADGDTDADGFLVPAIPALPSIDCELFALGAEVLQAYHDITGTDPSAADDLRIKRWTDIHVGTPHTFYDYVAIANNWRTWSGGPIPFESRRDTMYHEFGHSMRHADDGDQGHWGWDNFRWAYARSHSGNEIFNEQYAFNEGWGQYWECTQAAPPAPCPFIGRLAMPDDRHIDWVELLVGRQLLRMSGEPGVGHAAMARLSRDFPGSIHTLRDFETRYCERFRDNAFCSAGAPTRTKTSCPPNFHDDGATCRFDNILAKNSYGRGAGEVPTICAGDRDAGLCYAPCEPGFDGVGPVCWRRCPPGMQDDGAFCRRDVNIIASDNSRCPWWDTCGLVTERGCSTCPAGFQNDGCTCRVDAWIFAKESYGRGVGTISTDCGPGREYDAGLCYPLCRDDFRGVGPVCWGSCPAGYADHGATCYQDPQVIVKY